MDAISRLKKINLDDLETTDRDYLQHSSVLPVVLITVPLN